MRRVRFATLAFVSATLLAVVACGGDGGGESVTPYPETFEIPTRVTTATSTDATTPPATSTGGPGIPNEGGEAPIFWRTADDFASVMAGQPYTVLFRITNGYDEPALSVTATCVSCDDGEQQTVTFEGQNSPPFPAGSDLPGSYYPMNIVVPVAGQWELLVRADADEVTIPIDVAPAP